MMNSRILIYALVFTFVAISCVKEEAPPTTTPSTPKVRIPVPKFERDSAYLYVKEQVDHGPRVPNSDAHRACKDYLESKLQDFGWELRSQAVKANRYDGTSMSGWNIIGQYRPELNNRIVLAAHWDSRFIADQDDDVSRQNEAVDGANDGASGVGVLLEIARIMRDNPIDLGVDIVFFDLEDQGEDTGNNGQSWALGAQHWSRNTHTPPGNIKFGILLDMVGAKNARFGKEYYSMQYAPEIVNKVWRRAQSMGFNQYFVNERVNGVTDDHYFVNTIGNIPMIDIIDFNNTRGFFEHWHTHGDDMSSIDAKTLGAVGQVLLAVLYKSAEGSF